MAFPTQENKRTLATELVLVQSQASSLKRTCTQARDMMASGPVTAELILSVLTALRLSKEVFERVGSLPGMGDYAQAQFANAGYNIATDFNAMVTAINGAAAWIITNLPKQVSNNILLIQTINLTTGVIGFVQFSSAQTAPLRLLLADVIASID